MFTQHSPNIHPSSLLEAPGLQDGIFGLRGGGGRHREAHLVQRGALGGVGPGADVAVSIAVRRIVAISIESSLKLLIEL